MIEEICDLMNGGVGEREVRMRERSVVVYDPEPLPQIEGKVVDENSSSGLAFCI